MPQGTLFDEVTSDKQPVEDECASPTSPTGQINQDNFSFEGTGETGPSEEKAKTTNPCSGQGAGASNSPHKNQQTPGVSSHKQYKGFESTSEGACGYTDHGLGHGSSSFSSVPQQSMPANTASQSGQGASGYTDYGLGYGSVPQQGMPHETAAQLQMLQQLMQQFGSGPLSGLLADQIPSYHPSMFGGSDDAPASDSPSMQPRSYDKGGYSVVVTNGTLCQYSDEKGVVEMESGSPFKIAIANDNDYGELIFKFDKMLMLAINWYCLVGYYRSCIKLDQLDK